MRHKRFKHGEYYHIHIRGNDQESIFQAESHYDYFLELYRKYIHPLADLYAFSLLPTQFQFLIMFKELEDIDLMYADEDTLWQQIQYYLGTYTRTINRSYQRSGSLFSGKFSRLSKRADEQFLDLIIQIHHNPQSHGVVLDYRSWPFSSYHAYQRRDRRSLLARRLFADDHLYSAIMAGHQRLCRQPDRV